MSLKSILRGLTQLALIYLVLAVVAEVGVAMYVTKLVSSASADEGPSDYGQASISGLRAFVEKAGLVQWRKLWLVKASLWVFHDKVHYLMIFLAGAALLYKFKERALEPPPITKRYLMPEHEHDQNKRIETREAVAKLKSTPAFIKWFKEKDFFRWSPPEEPEEQE
jgi:hypothetical protein